MIRTDLRNGMVIEYQDGEKAIVKDDLFLDIIDLSIDAYISDYDINFDDTEVQEDWKIVKIYDNIINMNLLWERKDTSSRIKPIGYEYKGYKLGDKVKYKDRFENIIGFDERGISIYGILITSTTETDETMEFKDAKDITSSLDVADTQLVNWVSIKEIEESIKNPKAKYVKVIKCSSKEYWYNKNIGDIFKVYSQEEGLYDVYDNSDKSNGNLINSNDCVVISKNDLMLKGCKVKFKKNINEKYLWNIPKKEIEEFGNKVFTVTSYSEKEDYDDFTSVQIGNENYHFDIRLLKPVL